jgi:hypothetical protein
MTDQMAVLEQVIIAGDLSRLSAADRVGYYRAVCESVGLNPLTRPLEYLNLSGRLVLYARKDATDQLRRKHGVSITKVEDKVIEGVYIVTAYARDHAGREDSEIGAVPIDGLKGEFRSNAMMKAHTKAKRRVTLSICGLGMLDETEVEGLPNEPVGYTPNAGPLDIDKSTQGTQAGALGIDKSSQGDVPAPPAAPPAEAPDRDTLLSQIKATADALGLRAAKRADLWARYCGGDPRTVDVAMLQDLLAALRTMQRS